MTDENNALKEKNGANVEKKKRLRKQKKFQKM